MNNGDQQGLRTPSPRWISSLLLYVWVSARRWSRRCSQNYCRPFLRAVRFFTWRHQLHYIMWNTFFPTRSVINKPPSSQERHHRDRRHALTPTYNNCAETHLGGGVMSPFVYPTFPIAQAHDPTVIGSVALRTGPQRFCPHCSDRCHALMLTCQNSPLWQCCERCNSVLSSFWPPWLARTWSFEQLNSVVIMWHVLIEMSRKLAANKYTSSLALWTMLEYELVDGSGVCPGIQKVRVEPTTRCAVATSYPSGREKLCHVMCDVIN